MERGNRARNKTNILIFNLFLDTLLSPDFYGTKRPFLHTFYSVYFHKGEETAGLQ